MVVHRTPTDEVNLDNKPEAFIKFLAENDLTRSGYHVEEMVWLRKKGADLGKRASLGIWFDSPAAVEWAIRNGVLFGHQSIGSVELYEPKRKRCYRCLNMGHLAWN